MAARDIYVLEASKPFKIRGREEITANLTLRKLPPRCGALLRGRVFSECLPVKNATVLIFDRRRLPVAQATTDEEGAFSGGELEPGRYFAVASAAGYWTSRIKRARLRAQKPSSCRFVLKDSRVRHSLRVIAEAVSGSPLCGASVFCRSAIGRGGISVSNAKGQYLIYGVEPGAYELFAIKRGYRAACAGLIEIDGNARLKIDMRLEKERE
jgi:hypothetical protein